MSAVLDAPSGLDAIDRALVNHLHGGFPLSEQPFAEVGAALGLSEADVIARLQRLLDSGVLTRFGPLFQIEAAGSSCWRRWPRPKTAMTTWPTSSTRCPRWRTTTAASTRSICGS